MTTRIYSRLVGYTTVAVLTCPVSGLGHADSSVKRGDESVSADQCVKTHYDRHDELAFTNSCDETVQVRYIFGDPGRSYVESHKGYTVAVCPDGYRVVTSNGKYWDDDRLAWTCQRKK